MHSLLVTIGVLIDLAIVISATILLSHILNKPLPSDFWSFFKKEIGECIFIGIIASILLEKYAQYYLFESRRPVINVVKSSVTGHATNIIQGLAYGLQATAWFLIVLVVVILWSNHYGGILGIAIGATTTIILVSPAYFYSLLFELKTELNRLSTISYCTASIGLGGLILFITYIELLLHFIPEVSNSLILKNPFIIVGLFLGGLFIYLYTSLRIRINIKKKDSISISNTFKNEFSQSTLLSQSLLLVLVILLPILYYIVIHFIGGKNNALTSLSAFLLGSTIVGLYLTIAMTSSGGIWVIANNYIKDNIGDKKYKAALEEIMGSPINLEASLAAQTGATVGDIYYKTGKTINPIIKIMSIVSILLLYVVVYYIKM